MPPENSPNDTRPSTPRTNPSHHSLSSHPYLQQIEQSISTPVPDLASTLTTPDRAQGAYSATRSPHREAWNHNTSTQRSYNSSPRASRPRSDSALAESLDRMQSELDRWQTERNRLRAFLNNQQTRQSMLEEQNSQLRQEHSRLVEENSRLFSSTSADSPIHLPSDILSVDVDSEATNLQNLASAIAEVGRDNYSTRGAAPARQRLYDWAATHRPNATTSQDPTMPQESSSRLVDNPRYRELDRALHNYRVARSSLRSERPGNDLGTVPTAAALRAYWNEDEQPVAADHRPPFSLHNFVERHRRDRAARTVDSTTDVQATDAATSVPTSLSDSAALKERIRNTIRYLSKLRKSSPEGGLQLARLLHLDVLYECDDANTPSDLPLLVDNLPQPQPSSWLAPGMTWHGLQSTDRDYRPGTSLLSSTLRSIRQREYFGRSTIRRGVIDSQHSTYASILSTNPEARDTTNSDRYLSSLMRDPDGRWGFSNTRDHAELPDSAVTSSNRTHSSAPAGADADHWPVTVTLHTVDYDSMTVTGTMRASQIPDRNSTGVGKSMESYFQGEIIDFRNHSLETDSRQGYKVGGCDVDARYWSRLGPFKHAIEKQASSSYWESSIWEEKLKTGDAKYFEMLRAADRENREIEADRVMMQCLGNQRWLQKHLGSEWVLMRWKERCFVDPILPPGPEHAASTTPTSPQATTPYSYWGLTISGFYYVALNRQTGQIDGLYYDPGSQPYQSLRLAPEGTKVMMDEKIKSTQQDSQPNGPNGGANITLRKWWPSVEFR